jgi:sugar (glycoside-pentoside-hexuronide) transporter
MNKVAISTRVGYALGDTAGQLVFAVISNYLLYFYTDVYGLSVGIAGTILLVARFIDAVDAPVWGIILDKTRSRWGKSRPWFLWLCLPYATFGVLTFLTPNLSGTAKVLYAAGTYIICGIIFTGINTPLTSILSALTPDPRQRVGLTTCRMIGSKAGVLLVNATALPLIAWLGHGNDQIGFRLTMLIYATGSVLLFLLTFRYLVEIIPVESKRMPIRHSFGALKGNWPWIIIAASTFCFWIAFISKMSASIYFFTYTMDRKDLVPLANGLDMVSLTSILFLGWMCKFLSKSALWILGLVGSVVGQMIVYCGAHSGSLPIVMTGWIFGIVTSGIAMTLPFSVLSDSVDFGEWKTGIRAAGLLTAVGAAFCLKAGAGIGGALPAWIMSAYGYVPKAAQTPQAITGIEIGFIWLPALFFALAIVPVLFYKKYEVMEPQIHAELERRRKPPNEPLGIPGEP